MQNRQGLPPKDQQRLQQLVKTHVGDEEATQIVRLVAKGRGDWISTGLQAPQLI